MPSDLLIIRNKVEMPPMIVQSGHERRTEQPYHSTLDILVGPYDLLFRYNLRQGSVAGLPRNAPQEASSSPTVLLLSPLLDHDSDHNRYDQKCNGCYD